MATTLQLFTRTIARLNLWSWLSVYRIDWVGSLFRLGMNVPRSDRVSNLSSRQPKAAGYLDMSATGGSCGPTSQEGAHDIVSIKDACPGAIPSRDFRRHVIEVATPNCQNVGHSVRRRLQTGGF